MRVNQVCYDPSDRRHRPDPILSIGAAWIELIDENGGGPGVRLRKRRR